jgi:hypothetical protein
MALKGSILGMGNPLLDIIADVDDAFLAKYEVRRLPRISIDVTTDYMVLAAAGGPHSGRAGGPAQPPSRAPPISRLPPPPRSSLPTRS